MPSFSRYILASQGSNDALECNVNIIIRSKLHMTTHVNERVSNLHWESWLNTSAKIVR